MQNARLDDSQAGIKIAGTDINNFRYADDTTLMAENKRLEISSRKLEIPREHFMQRWAQ